ncbi:hypothetical protein [Brevibacillus porteri]|uniref:hypothetical protein n=1 Tax=Brevibacillus porteri TaxID=2126350 RepID=UPI003D1D2229
MPTENEGGRCLIATITERARKIEREFAEQLDAYYASPTSGFHDNAIARKFYEQKIRHLAFKPYPNDGLVTFGASGTDKCDLEVFFRNQKVKPQKSDDLPFRGRQRRQGSAIIEYVQLDLVHMRKRLGDAAKFEVMNVPNPGTSSYDWMFEDAAQQRKVFEYDGVKFAITAKPDGLLDYLPDSTPLLFEYKTKASGIRAMNSKLDYTGPQADHLRQVTAESLVFGIREGILLYESTQKPAWFSDEDNANVTKGAKTWRDGTPIPDIRPFYFCITDEMQEALLRDLARQARTVYEGEKPDVTADMTTKCGFCPYFGGHCQTLLSVNNLTELQTVDSRMARSTLAGKRDHRSLRAYLDQIAEVTA